MKYLAAIDQGTSSTRAMLYTLTGELIHASQYPLTQYYPELGYVEHCPEEIWTKTLTALKDVVQLVDKKDILALGITNQRETIVAWDKKTGDCVYKAIVWQDRRTEDFCLNLSDYAGLIHDKTGLFPDAYFSASKLHWMFQHIPQLEQLAGNNQLAVGTIDSFLIWRLTKGRRHVTDITNASRTLLFNINQLDWDAELLKIFQVPPTVLPEVLSCDGDFGYVDAEFLGFPLAITGVAGDQHAALIGQRCFLPGNIKATYGTGGFLLMNTGEQKINSRHRLLTTIGYQFKNKLVYALEGSLYHAGTTIKWLRDELCIINTAAETEELAASLNSNDGVYLIPSFTGLGAPYWTATQGAVIVGISRTTGIAHFARAALESVCYLSRELIECMRKDSQLNIDLLRVDGGMAANRWFLQFLANQCYLTVEKPKNVETTALGAAMLAGIGCGALSVTRLVDYVEMEQSVEVSMHSPCIDKDFAGWNKAISMMK